MEYHYNMVLEDNSAKEIGKALLTIRRELYASIKEKGTLDSVELEKLRAFNDLKNEAKKRRLAKEAEDEKDDDDDSDEDEEVPELVGEE